MDNTISNEDDKRTSISGSNVRKGNVRGSDISESSVKKYDIAVIGAGPVGCYTASLLAKSGHKVTIYEEHKIIGSPIQCTGLLTSEFDKFFPNINVKEEDFFVNQFNTVEVYSENNFLKTKQKEYLVCRTKFDQFFAKMARDNGAIIKTNNSFLRIEKNGPKPTLIIKDKEKNEEFKINPDFVIGSDGPLSKTAKAYGLYHKKRENYFGVQAVIEGDFEKKAFTVYFDTKLCPDFFAWVVPESKNLARVGLASKSNSKQHFDKLMEKLNQDKSINKGVDTGLKLKVKSMQAGVIPIFSTKQKSQKDNLFLVGDSAGHVKATTLGGLIPGMRAGRILNKCINDGSYKNTGYHKALIKLRVELLLHRQISDLFYKFSDLDWDKLISYIKQEKVKKVLEKYSRDNPIPLTFFALIKEPRFLYFLKHFI